MSPMWIDAVLQSAPLIEWEPIKVPVYIVAFGVLIVMLAKAALYGQQFASGKGSHPTGADADDREILVLVRQGHEIQQSHLEELKLLRADLQEHQNATREMITYVRRHEQEAAPAIEKIHRLHDSYFERDEDD